MLRSKERKPRILIIARNRWSLVLYLHSTSVTGSDSTPSRHCLFPPPFYSFSRQLSHSPACTDTLWVSGCDTWDVGGDLSEGGLTEALGRAGSNRDQVGGSRVEVGEHVVGLVFELGHGSSRSRDVNAWVWWLDTLVADLWREKKKSNVSVCITWISCFMIVAAERFKLLIIHFGVS